MQSKKDFIKLFSKYIITFLFPTLLISVGIISFLFAQLASQIKDNNLNVLKQSQSLIDANMKSIISLSYQISNNKKISERLVKNYKTQPDKNFNAWEISQEMDMYQQSGTLFEKLAIYAKASDMIIEKSAAYPTNDYLFKLFGNSEDFDADKIKELLLTNTKGGFLVLADGKSGNYTSVYYRTIKAYNNVASGALLAVVNQSAISSLIQPITSLGSDCGIIIADEYNNIIFSSQKSLNIKNDDGTLSAPSGYRLLSSESETFNINYIFFYKSGVLYGKIKYFAFTIFGLILFAVLLSAVLAKKHAGKMNEIVFSVLDENMQMKEGLELQLEEEKKKRFAELLQNNYAKEENDLRRQFNFKHEKTVVVILKQSDYCENDIPLYSEIDDETLKRIHGIVLEQLECCNLLYYAIRYGTLGYIYALNFEDFDVVKAAISNFCETLKRYNIQLSIGIGATADEISHLHKSYNEAVSAFRYSTSTKSESPVYYEDIQKHEKNRFYYTSDQEKLIIGSVNRGQAEKVVKILDDIFENNFMQRQISFTMSKRLIYNMVLTLYKIFDDIYPKDDRHQEQGNRLCRKILNSDDIEECFEYIKETLISISDDVNRRNSADVKESEAKEYILSHYSDKNLSLTFLADELGMNYYTLSRLFNERMGVSFVSYLTTLRLEAAEKLLLNSNMKIEQISEKVGFLSNSTFIKAFKKYYNETPSAYRKTYKKD